MRPRCPTFAFPVFWLLATGWLCASLPTTAASHAFAWISGAGHFSHQRELGLRVAALLEAESSVAPETVADATSEFPESAPAIPASPDLKRIDLALHSAAPWLGIFPAAARRGGAESRPPESWVAKVPCPPPRAA